MRQNHCRSTGVGRPAFFVGICIAICFLSGSCLIESARATEVIMKDGRVLHGKMGKVSNLRESPAAQNSPTAIPNIILLDDDLRRVFVPEKQLREVRQEENRQVEEKFSIRQRVLRTGQSIQGVGRPLDVEAFDAFGRRVFRMPTMKGDIDVIQGITEITPSWTKVEGISHVWDMRMATSAIPRDIIQKILLRQIDPSDIEQRKKIARFYLQSERYEEAKRALDDILKAFPGRADLKEQLTPSLKAIAQLSAQQKLRELQVRRDAGQHQLVRLYLQQFPTDDVSGEVLQGVREMIQQYDVREERRRAVGKQIRALAKRIQDTIAKENLKPIIDEIESDINLNTIDRMAAFLQNADKQTPDAEQLALAVSGWVLGADGATEKLTDAITAYRVRNWVREYLRGKNAAERDKISEYVRNAAGKDLRMVTNLIAKMKPPFDLPESIEGKPGYYAVQVPTVGKEPPATYYVQLPPEYDPYRRYPAIVTLHASKVSAEQQVDWWAGSWNKKGERVGQATRRGYIVISPDWTVERQNRYGYTAREHAAVLSSLRDACRRFSIDTDRVYLSGHSIGGDAVWDIGLAHPDLWAGVIPIVPMADYYCQFYADNGRYVPFYFVTGELDGGKRDKNAAVLDRWYRYGQNFNVTMAEYRGRGHEDFYEDILHIFDWMSHMRRNFFPREFKCKTMRQWDNFFWWIEIQGFPPRGVVDPADWPPPKGTMATLVEATMPLNTKNIINVRTGASHATVWISPEMFDFTKKINVMVNAQRFTGRDQMVKPDVHTLLEDVRTRGDRQHPFWARLDGSTGRVGRGE